MRAKIACTSLLVALLSIQVQGCASAQAGPGRGAPAAGVEVTIVNHNFADMDVFAMRRGGIPFRLGMALGLSTSSFPMPRQLVADGSVRIVAVPIGGFGAAGSGVLQFRRGDNIEFTVGSTFAQSSVRVH